jgi:hypothetical protein
MPDEELSKHIFIYLPQGRRDTFVLLNFGMKPEETYKPVIERQNKKKIMNFCVLGLGPSF